MTGVHRRHALLLLGLFASFCAGVLVDRWLGPYGLPEPERVVASPTPTPPAHLIAEVAVSVSQLAVAEKRPTLTATPIDIMAAQSVAGVQPVERLRLPIDGVNIESFEGGFSETRGSRGHEAVDIVVPRGTPIHAVQDGTIAKLFFSQYGGITIYQFDPDGRLCYYYAHLDRYADGLHDGQHVSRGEVIGFVGSSGNAKPETPHLHFAVFELNADRKWWQGRPLDPYVVFKEKGSPEAAQK